MSNVSKNPDHSEIIQSELQYRDPWDIYLLHCRHCGGISYYNLGFFSTCEWCGNQITGDIDQDEDYYSLEEYWLEKVDGDHG